MGDEYRVLVSEEVMSVIDNLDEKSERIVRENLGYLEDPYPSQGQGDKELLHTTSRDKYRLHIGRTWTAIYVIFDDRQKVRVTELLTIDAAHKKYGQLD